MNILVVLPLEEEGKRRLEAAAPSATFFYEVTQETVTQAEIIIGNLPVAYLPDAKNVKWEQLSMAGTEPYVNAGVLPEGTLLTNATGAFGLAISEHMLGCVLMLYKKLHLYRDNQQQAQWLDRGNVRAIRGSVVLSVGMGDIGTAFAQKMKALGAYVIGVRRADLSKVEGVDEIYTSESLDALLPRADIVALSMPNTPDTRGMFSQKRIFEQMKDGAVLLNVGRGNAVDTDALAKALQTGKLSGAAVDVTDPEPLPPEHPLWKCENAIITPHVSGFFHLRETYDAIVELSIRNLQRYVAGQTLENLVDYQTGYRRLLQ